MSAGHRYEIIDGMLYVTPSPGTPHQRALSELIGPLWPYAKRVGLYPMTSPADIEFSEHTVVQPDLFVFTEPSDARQWTWSEITSRLVLAVEVLSPSMVRRDRIIKRRLYQTQRIPEYWIIDAVAREIQRWRPDSSEPETVSATLDWCPVSSRAPLCIDVASISAPFTATDPTARAVG